MQATTFRINAALRAQLSAALQRQGISLRRKSRWICAAIHSLFAEDPGLAGVGAGEDLEAFDLVEPLQLDDDTYALIGRAHMIMLESDPQLVGKGVQSSVVRAAIRSAVRRKVAA
jgi:hypothetical protein